MLLLLPFLIWFGNGLLLCKVVHDIRQMNGAEIDRFLAGSQWKENKFALNAILGHQDLEAPLLEKIARIPSPALHESLGSFFPVMGENTKGISVMRLVASHRNADEQTLTLLSATPDDYLLGDIAGNSNTPPEILERLARKGGYLIEWGLARNPHTNPATLHALASAASEYIRAPVAGNPSTKLEDLQRLSQDPVWHVRDRVLMNPSCPESLRESLRNDPDERIRRRF